MALGGLKDFNEITITDEAVTLGAGLTHARLAAALAELPELRGLAQAAGRSANPAIRQVATLGGNLCATEFPAADLPPALLALEASVWLHRDGSGVAEELPLEDFLARRDQLLPGALVVAVSIPRTAQRSAHARLPQAGDAVLVQTDLYEGAPSLGPLGAKGAGEIPILNVAAAVACAVANATGRRVQEIPLTPPRVLDLLCGEGEALDLGHMAEDWWGNVLAET
ncbi:MAG: FAD binding domain-containing protein [Pseudomonadota bacterium]